MDGPSILFPDIVLWTFDVFIFWDLSVDISNIEFLLLSLVQFVLNQEVSKFINQCNEIKAATLATKDGGQLGIIKPPLEGAK